VYAGYVYVVFYDKVVLVSFRCNLMVVVCLIKRVIVAITTSDERERERDGKAASYTVCRPNAEFKSWMRRNDKNSKR
jgi:hypothetical protein